MTKTIFMELTIVVIAIAMITSAAAASVLNFTVMGVKKVPGSESCVSDVPGFKTCCWTEVSNDGKMFRHACKTCDGGGNCTTSHGNWFRSSTECPSSGGFFGGIIFRTLCQQNQAPTPGPATGGLPSQPTQQGPILEGQAPKPGPAAQDPPKGGIFQGDVIPTPGPAAQDQSSTTQEEPSDLPDIFQGGTECVKYGPFKYCLNPQGIFQGNLLESFSQPGLVQNDPDSVTSPETNATQSGAPLSEDLQQLGATQDNETTSEQVVTQEPPATEETQPALVQEEPVPPVCPEGQVLDEETNLCVLEEPQADEPEQEEQEEAEEEPSSEEGGEN